MPGGQCGIWPAWWLVGPNWPNDGEIDIIEGVNSQQSDTITLHTSETCSMDGTGSLSSSAMSNEDCGADDGSTGCGYSTTDNEGYGSGFNAAQGGVYVMEWTSDAISVWHWSRANIPSDIAAGNPDPSGWGTPSAQFQGSGCDIDTHFQQQSIVFDTTFCGSWAGQADVWAADSTCSALASDCNSYVAANPSAFTDAYWLVNSVKVYQDNGSSGNSTKRSSTRRRSAKQWL